jgi:Asp-tRNA(Asn)/Glu-tRNA(Gln) amidotransferase A subunit family amidase
MKFDEPITTNSNIDEIERHFAEIEPKIRAFLEEPGRFARLRDDAASLVARFPDPGARPPLFGIPVAVKDIFNVDGFETRLSPLALGTQTVGSLVRPAAYCGICAFKPTYDRIDKAGVVPLAPRSDHVGFLTNDVSSISVAASVLCDDWTGEPEVATPVIGIPHADYLDHAEDTGRAHFGMVREMLEIRGFSLVTTDALSEFDALHERHIDLCAIEAAEVHQSWRAEWEKEYDPRTLKLLDRAGGLSDARRTEVIASQLELRRDLEELMDRNGIDLWLAPAATGPAPLGIGDTGNGIMNSPWTHAGMPTIGIPAGRTTDGLPMGIQLTGRFGSDERTIAQARHIEGALKAT